VLSFLLLCTFTLGVIRCLPLLQFMVNYIMIMKIQQRKILNCAKKGVNCTIDCTIHIFMITVEILACSLVNFYC